MDGISRVFCRGMFYNGYGTLSLASGDTISLKSDILFIYRSAAKSQVSLGCTVGRAANNCTTSALVLVVSSTNVMLSQ